MARDVAAALSSAGRTVRMLSGDSYLAGIVSGAHVRIVPRNVTGVLRALIWCDELIFAGGTVFHDSFTDAEFHAYLRHLKLYAWLFRGARLAGKRVRLVGIGLGPLRRPAARAAARRALNAANTLYLRDQASMTEAEALNAGPAPVLGPDLSMLGAQMLGACGRAVPVENRLGVSILDMSSFLPVGASDVFWTPICEAVAARLEAEPDLKLTVFAFWTAPGRPGDHAVAERFIQALPERVRDQAHLCTYAGDLDAVVKELARCRAILATRFHAAVLARVLGRSFAVISYNRKVSDFANDQGLPAKLRLPGDRVSSAGEVCAVIDALLCANTELGVQTEQAAAEARRAVNAVLKAG